jgi:hypothetical protein
MDTTFTGHHLPYSLYKHNDSTNSPDPALQHSSATISSIVSSNGRASRNATRRSACGEAL